jgi:hypothetical protein
MSLNSEAVEPGLPPLPLSPDEAAESLGRIQISHLRCHLQ